MPSAIEQLKGDLTVGYAGLGLHGGSQGTIRQQVHDGDTIIVRAATSDPGAETGNFSVRFLGVDAPEISFSLPGGGGFVYLSSKKWEAYLSDPFAEPFDPPLAPGLVEHLHKGVGHEAAANHYHHAASAEDALEEEILKDIHTLGTSEEGFRFFLIFAYEVMDRYGRFLCYVNRFQPDTNEPEPRPKSYNERLLQAGKVSPYFIWPNVDPFRKSPSVVEAVPEPGAAGELASALRSARKWVRQARDEGLGIFDSQNPLMLQPFEVRFLGRRSPPDRWVVDLSREDDILIQPQRYWTVPNVEDRLFIPEEYVPLFVEKGWRRQVLPGENT